MIVKPIDLPRTHKTAVDYIITQRLQNVITGETLTVTGWGMTPDAARRRLAQEIAELRATKEFDLLQDLAGTLYDLAGVFDTVSNFVIRSLNLIKGVYNERKQNSEPV